MERCDLLYEYNKKALQGVSQAGEGGQVAKARGIPLPCQQFRGLSNSSQLRGMFDPLSVDHAELPVPEVEPIGLPLLPPLVFIAISDQNYGRPRGTCATWATGAPVAPLSECGRTDY